MEFENLNENLTFIYGLFPPNTRQVQFVRDWPHETEL